MIIDDKDIIDEAREIMRKHDGCNESGCDGCYWYFRKKKTCLAECMYECLNRLRKFYV